MPRTRATGNIAGSDTNPLDWWAATAHNAISQQARFTPERDRYPSIVRAELIRRGPTSIQKRSINTTSVPVLAVSRTDLETYTGTAEGQWLTVRALSWARYPTRQHQPSYATPTLMLILAALCAFTAVNDDADNASQLSTLIAAIFLTPVGVWLLRYRHRRFQNRTWAADSEATNAAGLPAAKNLLTPCAPELHKTALHTWINQHRTMTPTARLQRLCDRSDGRSLNLLKP